MSQPESRAGHGLLVCCGASASLAVEKLDALQSFFGWFLNSRCGDFPVPLPSTWLQGSSQSDGDEVFHLKRRW